MRLKPDKGHIPANSLKLGTDGSYLVICHSEKGEIPGKADSNGRAWYGWGGKVFKSPEFSWVICRPFLRGQGELYHLRHMSGEKWSVRGGMSGDKSSVRILPDNRVDGGGDSGLAATWKV